MKLLALPPRRFDPRNHTIPVLDILTLDEWRFVIMPPWNIDIVNRHPCWEIREYLTSTQQVLEVSDHTRHSKIYLTKYSGTCIYALGRSRPSGRCILSDL